MGAKKKGRKNSSSSNAGRKSKQSNASAADVGGKLRALSLSLPPAPAKLNDVSSLLFNNDNDKPTPFALPFIGPISISERRSEDAKHNEEGSVIHGRGLVTTRDVSSGECLFVTPSIVSADAAQVHILYLQEKAVNGDVDSADLERITENHLVERVQSLCEILDDEDIQPKANVDRARMLLRSLSAQMSSDEVPKTENPDELMNILLANESSQIHSKDGMKLDRDTTLKIIRRNAFGPDYHSYDAIAQCWSKRSNTGNYYNRLLAAYPLSAVINHSCVPNAVRVYGRVPSKSNDESDIDNIQGKEVMIVHATANIPKGTEITWSYLPPATPFAVRREKLESNYGFTCQCMRCSKEEEALQIAECKELCANADRYWSARDANKLDEIDATMMNIIPSMEKIFASTKLLSKEAQRCLRVGYTSLYMEIFNKTLSFNSKESMSKVLKLATQLHFSFVSCNNVSTEHLSIIHLCYDLSAMLHNHAMKGGNPDASTKTHFQLKFWTEQLKKAVMVRYGELGEDLENVREVMKHSKLVLRNRDGWYSAKHRFI